MAAVLLDTDVLSFVAKADKRAALYANDLAGRQLTVCFQTIAELRLWALLRHWGKARQTAMEDFLRQMAVVPYDARMAGHWAGVTAHRRRAGRPIECGDAWIAAAALRHDVPLITNNASHYMDIPGLKLVSHADETTPR